MLGAAALAVLLTWRSTSLSGLPDVGDPFDVDAFCRPIPDESNAFVLYREAVARLANEPRNPSFHWGESDEAQRRWLEDSRGALALWLRGTERPDAQYQATRSVTVETQLPVIQSLRSMSRLAVLEGTRLEDEGDLEGARRLYRAIDRSGKHCGRRGFPIERLVGVAIQGVACKELTRWSADPRVDASMLRRALDDALADDRMNVPLSDSVKVEYVSLMNTYDDPKMMSRCLNENTSTPGRPGPLAENPTAFAVRRILAGEPERSRRVTRLIIADMLSWVDLPRDRRPPVAASIPNPNPRSGARVLLDLRGAVTPGPGRSPGLPPAEVARWFETTIYAKDLQVAVTTLDQATLRERAGHAQLIIDLASRLHERERGVPPDSPEGLVGPYLKALPEGRPAR